MNKELATYRTTPVKIKEKPTFSFWEKVKNFLLNDRCDKCQQSFRKSELGTHPFLPNIPICYKCDEEFWREFCGDGCREIRETVSKALLSEVLQ